MPINMWHLLFFLGLFLLVLSQHIHFHSYFIQTILHSPITDLYTFNWLMGYNNILCWSTSEFHNPFEFSSPWEEEIYHKSCGYMLCFAVSQPEESLQCSPSPLSSLHLEDNALIVEHPMNWRVYVALWQALHLKKFLCCAFCVYLFWPFINWNLCLKNRTFMLLVKSIMN